MKDIPWKIYEGNKVSTRISDPPRHVGFRVGPILVLLV